MTDEHEPEQVPSDDELDLEGPNEGAAGDNPELDVDLDELEDDDGHGSEEDDEY